MPQLHGLVFDLDGTLLDSAPDLLNATNQMLVHHDRRPLTLGEIKGMVGDGMLTMMQRALMATGGLDENKEMAYFKEMVTIYRSIDPDPAQIYPNIVEQLTFFKSKDVQLGVCTNKPQDATRQILSQLNLLHYFSFVAGGDTFMVHKPNPEHLYGVITAMEVEKDNCVMIGDSRNDVAAAHGLGIPCIVASLGYGTDFETLGADRIINDYADLPKTLTNLGFSF